MDCKICLSFTKNCIYGLIRQGHKNQVARFNRQTVLTSLHDTLEYLRPVSTSGDHHKHTISFLLFRPHWGLALFQHCENGVTMCHFLETCWLGDLFCNWDCFWTAPGYATTLQLRANHQSSIARCQASTNPIKTRTVSNQLVKSERKSRLSIALASRAHRACWTLTFAQMWRIANHIKHRNNTEPI